VRAFLDFLVALRGTTTVGLRRMNRTTLVASAAVMAVAALAFVAVTLMIPVDGDDGGPPAASPPGTQSGPAIGAGDTPATIAGGQTAPGSGKSQPRRARRAAAAGTPVQGSAGVGAGAGAAGSAAPPGAATGGTPTTGPAPVVRGTTTTVPTSTTSPTTRAPGDSPPGLIGGLLDLFGLG
jgi:hypothetical protein